MPMSLRNNLKVEMKPSIWRNTKDHLKSKGQCESDCQGPKKPRVISILPADTTHYGLHDCLGKDIQVLIPVSIESLLQHQQEL